MIKKKIKRRFIVSPAQTMVVGFALIILLGGILLNLPIASKSGEQVGFVNAVFTATSAVCVTGLVVVDTGTYWSTFGKFVIISLIQIGGLGFMSLATLLYLIVGKKISLKERLVMQESLNKDDLSGVVKLTRNILIGTFLIEFVGGLILATVFIPQKGLLKGLGYGFFHSVSAFCNAGFDLIGGGVSLIPYADNIVVNFTIMGLIILGGLGFTVIFDVLSKRNMKRLTLHSKLALLVTVILIFGGAILFFVLEADNAKTLGHMSMKGKFLGAMFQSVSPRTAGFNTINLAAMKDSSKFLTIILMFIGGSPASTAGGLKTVTMALLVITVMSIIQGKPDVAVFKRRISFRFINKALAALFMAMSLVIIVTMGLSLTENFTFLDILFETVSAFATVGLTLGITASLSTAGKLMIIFTMFAGRVGILTIFVALAGREKKMLFQYPEERVIVG